MDCTNSSAVRRPQTSTPALEALLPSQRSTPPLPLPASYNPTSLPALLTRLSSFKLTTFPSRPSPLSFALVGWTNSARNTLRFHVTGQALYYTGLEPPGPERFDEQPDRGQRSSQLVRDTRQEVESTGKCSVGVEASN